MVSNSFGKIFRISSFGESHGKAVGVLIDGCPAGLNLDEAVIERDLARRAPGSSPYVSPRKEKDNINILSGVFEGKTTGAPICIVAQNKDQKSESYASVANLFRPGHANYTYLKKYGIFDWRGGGRASARETLARVAAGAVARQFLANYGISATAWLSAVGGVCVTEKTGEIPAYVAKSPLFAPSKEMEEKFAQEIEKALKSGDSVGGVVSFVLSGLPPGLGEPVYDKLSARLGFACLSIPASKGFELGEGFAAASRYGTEFIDPFALIEGEVRPMSNHAGGLLGGISTGLSVYGRVAFKPTASIRLPIKTVDFAGQDSIFKLPEGSRHDPCVAVRAVPVVEAMCLLTLADAVLMNRAAKI